MTTRTIPATPATWRGLTAELAVIASAPGAFYPRAVPGGSGMPPDDTAEKYEPFSAEFETAVLELFPRSTAGDPEFKRDRYFPGPYGVGGPYEYVGVLLSLAPVAYATAQHATTWVQLGEYVVRLKRKWAEIYRREGVALRAEDAPVFSAPMVEALCIHHAFSRHGGPGTSIAVESVCRPFGAGSARHPTGAERYAVQVTVDNTGYFYSVDGHGRPWEHLRLDGAQATPLELPDFGDFDERVAASVGRGRPVGLRDAQHGALVSPKVGLFDHLRRGRHRVHL